MKDEQIKKGPFNEATSSVIGDRQEPASGPVAEMSSADGLPKLTPKQRLLRSIGSRLFFLLMMFLLAMGIWSVFVYRQLLVIDDPGNLHVGSLFPVIFSGVLGGIIGLQQRLNSLSIADLLLLRNSLSYLLLAPLVGGFLATLLYILFLGGLIQGGLFPAFEKDDGFDTAVVGMASIFRVHGSSYQDYGKLIFWSFLAGYSERFVTNIIGQFEGVSSSQDLVPQHSVVNVGSVKK